MDGLWNIQHRRGLQCLDGYWVILGGSIPHVVTDLALLLLPIASVWKLLLTRSQKIMLSLLFALGGLYVLSPRNSIVIFAQTACLPLPLKQYRGSVSRSVDIYSEAGTAKLWKRPYNPQSCQYHGLDKR